MRAHNVFIMCKSMVTIRNYLYYKIMLFLLSIYQVLFCNYQFSYTDIMQLPLAFGYLNYAALCVIDIINSLLYPKQHSVLLCPQAHAPMQCITHALPVTPGEGEIRGVL